MTKHSTPIGAIAAAFCGVLCLVLVSPRVDAQSPQGPRAAVKTAVDAPAEWHAWVGAESHDLGHQALAFLPNELWIHQGDSIKWRFAAEEIHTVSFLKTGQIRFPFFIGCPGFSADPSVFDNS